jgi:acyl-CoA dehydrogenase
VTALVWILIFIVGSIALMYQRVSLFIASLAYLGYLIIYTAIGTGPSWLALLFWIVWLGLVVLLNIRDLRRQWISKPLLELFRKVMPEMSETEAAALEAGTVGRRTVQRPPQLEQVAGNACSETRRRGTALPRQRSRGTVRHAR